MLKIGKSANKRLFKAAPDLLAACKKVVSNLHGTAIYPDLFQACKQAIAKAEAGPNDTT